MSHLNITVNGKATQVDGPISLKELLVNLDVKRMQVAVELNGQLIPREQHDQQSLSDNDAVEIVTLVGGG